MAGKREYDQLLGHAEDNDGIEEYDNPLPDWWIGLFFVCIVWAFGYAIDYHFVSERSQEAYYEAELAMAAETWPEASQPAAVVMTDEAIAAGAATYQGNCIGCHGAELEGGLGPNLRDAEWIHGGEPEQVLGTITEGVQNTAMIAWGPILGPKRIGEVAGFILSKNTGEAPAAGTPSPEGQPTQAAQPQDDATPDDPVAAGQALFATNCIACHGPDLKGNAVGPNLTDDEWIHGDTDADLVRTITNGIEGKAMIAWSPQLTEAQILHLVAYIRSKADSAGAGG